MRQVLLVVCALALYPATAHALKPFVSPIHAILAMEEEEALERRGAQDQEEKEKGPRTVKSIIRVHGTNGTDEYVVVPAPWCE